MQFIVQIFKHFTIDVHTGFISRLIKPRQLKVRPKEYSHSGSVFLESGKKAGDYRQLELRAVYKPQPPEIQKLAKTVRGLKETSWQDYGIYFTQKADLKATKKANLLNPKNIARIGHLIDTEVRTALGQYRKPRGSPYKDSAARAKFKAEKRIRRRLL